jgi:hypothetical protein
MRGIAGIFNFRSKEPISHRLIKSMTDVIAHRGPDGEGQYVDVNIALGHRRLAVIDLTPAGHQPMASEDGNPALRPADEPGTMKPRTLFHYSSTPLLQIFQAESFLMNFKNERFLVIGGAGFIGSHVVDELVKTDAKEIMVL